MILSTGHVDPDSDNPAAITVPPEAQIVPREAKGVDQRWDKISAPRNPLTQPFEYAENGDPGAIRGRAQLARRIRVRVSPARFANARLPASENHPGVRNNAGLRSAHCE